MGLAGAFLMGSAVFYINYEAVGTFTPAFTAALKQWVYTFFFGGIVIRSCEYFANTIPSKAKAITTATLIPSIVTILLVFGLHNLKGTPQPFESTLPSLIIIPGTFFWALRERRKKKIEENKLSDEFGS